MRRSVKPGQARPTVTTSRMSRDMDWLLDEWRTASPESRLKVVLEKIRQEERMPHEPKRAI